MSPVIYTLLLLTSVSAYKRCHEQETKFDCLQHCVCGWCDDHCIERDHASPYSGSTDSSGWGTLSSTTFNSDASGHTCEVFIPGDCLSILDFVGITAACIVVVFAVLFCTAYINHACNCRGPCGPCDCPHPCKLGKICFCPRLFSRAPVQQTYEEL